MQKLQVIYVVFSVVLCSSVVAQTKSNGFNFIETEKLKSFASVLPQKNSFIQQSPSLLLYNPSTIYSYNINDHTPKGAVFCRMENLSRERWNIWIQIHAGDRASYNISTNEK